MRVIHERPPLFDAIAAKFPIANHRGVIFAWGDKIYNPDGVSISRALFAHEKVHGERQGHAVEEWWDRYIDNPEFRLAEEIPAHRAEFRDLLAQHGDVRNNRRRFLVHVAARLASPLYGRMISLSEAKKAIAA